jgi:hypothetical protein
MAKKKGSAARDQRRREAKEQRRRKKRRELAQKATAASVPSAGVGAYSSTTWGLPGPHAGVEPSSAGVPMQDQYDIQGDVPDGGVYLDPHGRVARIEGSQLRVLSDAERGALGTNVPLDGSFGDFDISVCREDIYVLALPAIRDGVATMQVAARAASDTEVDGLVWHPTYTATVQWMRGYGEDDGEWVFEVQQDACPGDPVGRCGLGADGTDDFWEGSGDLTSELATSLAADHLPSLLELARGLAAPT